VNPSGAFEDPDPAAALPQAASAADAETRRTTRLTWARRDEGMTRLQAREGQDEPHGRRGWTATPTGSRRRRKEPAKAGGRGAQVAGCPRISGNTRRW
jgi:hypothetical protein